MPRGRKGSTGKPELRAIEGGATNSTNDLNDEQKAKLFLLSVEGIERLIEEKDEIVALIRTKRKIMKSEGFDREEVDYALWFRKQGEIVAAEALGMRLRIAEWLGKPLGYQPKLDFGEGAAQ